MLALPLALLFALPSPQPQDATADTFAPSQEVAQLTPALIPYGTASGAWALYEDGAMVALLEDADGRPLFALDARMSATGEISGDLHTLEYVGNPALVLPHLRVVGQAQIPAAGNGSFSLVIYNPLEDDGYVFPNGQIAGVLTRRQGPMIQPGSGKEVANLFVLASQSAELYVANAIYEAWVATAETANTYTAAETVRIVPSADAVQRVDAFTAAPLDPANAADIARPAQSADSAQHVEAFLGAGSDRAVAAEAANTNTAAEIARIVPSADAVLKADAFTGFAFDPTSVADVAHPAQGADSALHVEAFLGAGADKAVAAEVAKLSTAAETARVAQSSDSIQRWDAITGASPDPIAAKAAQKARAEGFQPHTYMIVCPHEPPAGGQGQVLARWVLFL